MLQKNQVVTLFIQDMTTEGFGVAKYQDEQIKDFIVFVNNTVPGDTALCKIIKITKNYAIGKVETLLQASDQRIVSDCAVKMRRLRVSPHFLSRRIETQTNLRSKCI